MSVARRALLTALVSLVGAVVLLALTVYPFQYGLVESAVLALGLVAVGVFEIVLDDATFGAS